MFLVRMFLFMMSRGQAPSVLTPPISRDVRKTVDDRKIPTREMMTRTDKARRGPLESDVISPSSADGNITREEMLRLFGNALRVR